VMRSTPIIARRCTRTKSGCIFHLRRRRACSRSPRNSAAIVRRRRPTQQAGRLPESASALWTLGKLGKPQLHFFVRTLCYVKDPYLFCPERYKSCSPCRNRGTDASPFPAHFHGAPAPAGAFAGTADHCLQHVVVLEP